MKGAGSRACAVALLQITYGADLVTSKVLHGGFN